ncbi:hypothetical protein Cob_v003143 [Colletotrichum orbiculare MAFF 240422]|uniref:Uncharacterized protein n=1 Tax=Colletotrichum orbiculare (strain 104-T / ATCC 96160 / CBS 514.97 / LARS 414 / MAFF 240422) TaxID=1213857 RepID=N4V2U8_COLOR|nr:hypothetical protein Cob_v003143 [Colletotrichum orbiculare MAFF 240422]
MVTNPRLQASEAYRMPVDIMPEVRATQNEPISTSRKLSARLEKHVGNDSIVVSHGSEADALTIALNCTIRVPDNRDTNNLPPGLGTFPLFNVKDYAHKLPESMARKGGIFFPMYQKEAMWINFSASAPFAVKIYVGGVNAVSGFPMTANDQTKAKRKRMLQNGESIQDYMVLPEQRWLDGIVSEDGKIRQFVAQPKGSGYSVEAQVTGEENVGGIQIEIVPAKKNLPASFDVRYENKSREVVTRTFNLAEKAITGENTWHDVKKSISGEFGIPVEDQVLRDYSLVGRSYPPQSRMTSLRIDFNDETKLCDVYFPPKFSTLSVTHHRSLPRCGKRKTVLGSERGPAVLAMCAMPLSAAAAPEANEMGLAAGGLISQIIETDVHPADTWDVEASVMVNLQILDVESFCTVTGLPPPETPVDAAMYAQYDYPFFEIWGEEKTGIKGDFSGVKSVAQIDAEKAAAQGREFAEEASVPVRVHQIGRPMPFSSTFLPVEVLRAELEDLQI